MTSIRDDEGGIGQFPPVELLPEAHDRLGRGALRLARPREHPLGQAQADRIVRDVCEDEGVADHPPGAPTEPRRGDADQHRHGHPEVEDGAAVFERDLEAPELGDHGARRREGDEREEGGVTPQLTARQHKRDARAGQREEGEGVVVDDDVPGEPVRLEQQVADGPPEVGGLEPEVPD